MVYLYLQMDLWARHRDLRRLRHHLRDRRPTM